MNIDKRIRCIKSRILGAVERAARTRIRMTGLSDAVPGVDHHNANEIMRAPRALPTQDPCLDFDTFNTCSLDNERLYEDAT